MERKSGIDGQSQKLRHNDRRAYQHLYHTKRWKDTRLAVLNERPLCEWCEAQGLTVAATIVDHKVNHKGDEALFFCEGDQLNALCKPCHDTHAQRRDHGKDVRAIGLDGWFIGER